MRSIAEKLVRGQEELEKLGNKNVEQCLRHIDSEEFWENLLLRLKKRGLTDKQLSLITVDGNPGLLAALKTCFPDVKVQRCTVHKLKIIARHCPRALQGVSSQNQGYGYFSDRRVLYPDYVLFNSNY